MSDYAIARADLSTIERNLDLVCRNINTLNENIVDVDQRVVTVYSELKDLAQEFHDFVIISEKKNNVSVAETRLGNIRQEIQKKFGHYDMVRRTTTGILQADDLGIVRQNTLTGITEELMVTTPNYWLAPCLVALSAWINDKQDLANKALNEAIKRDDEKTSLLFALICQRANRKEASLKWTQRYLAIQDEENLNRNAIIILDAFASGLMGADSDGIVTEQIQKWIDYLSSRPGFIELQRQQWSIAILNKKKELNQNSYPYLRKMSATWPVLESVIEGAYLHTIFYEYMNSIFLQKDSTDMLNVQLDRILNDLVTEYDNEELTLKKKERYNALVVEHDGDLDKAKASLNVEENMFESHKNFTQLLTDSAMNPEVSHASVSTQKFAIALSKDWIIDAYNDIVAKNRSEVPLTIQIDIDTYHGETTDGENENDLVKEFITFNDKEKEAELEKVKLSSFQEYSLYVGICLIIAGLLFVNANTALGILLLLGGIYMSWNGYKKKKTSENKKVLIEQTFALKQENGEKAIRAIIAEVVDYRKEFKEKDKESEKVLSLLNDLAPSQYVKQTARETRKISV